MNDFLFKLCIFLDNSKKDKCNEFLIEFLDLVKLILNSNFVTLIFFIIALILIKIFIHNNKKKKDKYFLIIAHFILFFFILINFRTNIPWVDDWEWIENLQLKQYSTIEWLLQPTNIHNIFFIKLIFLFVDKYFNLNFEFFSYLSITIIFLISYLLITKENKIDNNYILLIIFLIFSGKQFANFTQASNIAWTLCFFYIVLFYYYISKSRLVTSLIIIIAPSTFGLGYVIPLYTILFIYFKNLPYKNKLIYLILSILSILIASFIPQLFLEENFVTDSSFNYLKNIFNLNFYFTFFSVLANVYLPWVNGLSYLGFLIGLIQVSFLIYHLFKDYLLNGKSSLTNFFANNALLFIGFIFSFIVSLTRPELQTSVAARYSVGSIIFQIGFWLYFANNQKSLKLKKIFFIKILTIYIFLSGLFFPYQGIHWQAKRYSENTKVIKCFKNNHDYEFCIEKAYQILFYGGQWYNYDDFKLQIEYLFKNNKSFLNISEK